MSKNKSPFGPRVSAYEGKCRQQDGVDVYLFFIQPELTHDDRRQIASGRHSLQSPDTHRWQRALPWYRVEPDEDNPFEDIIREIII